MKRKSPKGNPLLTKRQIQTLLCYYPSKKPSLRQVAKKLGVGSALAARRHCYPLVRKGYMKHIGPGKHRCYRITEKGRKWCYEYYRLRQWVKRTRKNELLRQRNRYIYLERQRGETWAQVVYLTQRRSRVWPPIVNPMAAKAAAWRYAARHGLPTPIERVHPKKLPRRKK